MSCCSEDDLKDLEEIGIYDKSNVTQAVAVLVGFFGVFAIICWAIIIGG